MFRRILYLSFSLLALTLGAIYIFLVKVHSKDIPEYRRLIQASGELHSLKALETQPAHQFRKGVQKDIWMSQEKERLLFRLKSAQSHLTLTQKSRKVEATEELGEIECLIQEAIDSKALRQKVRLLHAEKGTYYFPSHHFFADTVHLSFYQIPGIELPSSLENQKPFLTGTAQKTSFKTVNKTPSFSASLLQLHLDPQKEF